MVTPEKLNAELAALQRMLDEAKLQAAAMTVTLDEVSATLDDLRSGPCTRPPQRHPFIEGFLGAFRLAGRLLGAMWSR